VNGKGFGPSRDPGDLPKTSVAADSKRKDEEASAKTSFLRRTGRISIQTAIHRKTAETSVEAAIHGTIGQASAWKRTHPEDCERLRPQQRSTGDLRRLRPRQRSKVNRHGASAPGGDPGEAPRSFGFETRTPGKPRKASVLRGEPNGMEASGPASRLSARTMGGTLVVRAIVEPRRDGCQALTGAAFPGSTQ
jgi:hypothetical protein